MEDTKMDNQAEQNPDSVGRGTIGRRANEAIKRTAQRYLRSVHVQLDLSQEEHFIRAKPLESAAIATSLGFILGGGLATRLGIVAFGVFGYQVFREAIPDSSGGNPGIVVSQG